MVEVTASAELVPNDGAGAAKLALARRTANVAPTPTVITRPESAAANTSDGAPTTTVTGGGNVGGDEVGVLTSPMPSDAGERPGNG